MEQIEELFSHPALRELNNYIFACKVHGCLSKALEKDRMGNLEGFKANIERAFYRVFHWAGSRGYKLTDSIYEKMEKNKGRLRLHGKKY